MISDSGLLLGGHPVGYMYRVAQKVSH